MERNMMIAPVYGGKKLVKLVVQVMRREGVYNNKQRRRRRKQQAQNKEKDIAGALHDWLSLCLYIGVVVVLCNSIVCHLSACSALCHANKAGGVWWVILD